MTLPLEKNHFYEKKFVELAVPLVNEFPDMPLSGASDADNIYNQQFYTLSAGDTNGYILLSGNNRTDIEYGQYDLKNINLRGYVYDADFGVTGNPVSVSLYKTKRAHKLSEGKFTFAQKGGTGTTIGHQLGVYYNSFDPKNINVEENFDTRESIVLGQTFGTVVASQPYILWSDWQEMTFSNLGILDFGTELSDLRVMDDVAKANKVIDERIGGSWIVPLVYDRIDGKQVYRIAKKREDGFYIAADEVSGFGKQDYIRVHEQDYEEGVETRLRDKIQFREITSILTDATSASDPMNGSLLSDWWTSKTIQSPFSADLDNALIYSTIEVTDEGLSGNGKALRVYHEWDYADNNRATGKAELGGLITPQCAMLGFYDIPMPLTWDVGSDRPGDRRTYLPHISMDINIKQLGATPLYAVTAQKGSFCGATGAAGTPGSGDFFTLYTEGTRSSDVDDYFTQDAATQYRDSSDRAESLLRTVCVVFSNLKPREEHNTLDKFLDYCLTQWYGDGVNSGTNELGVVGGIMFRNFGAYNGTDGDPDSATIEPQGFETDKIYAQALPVTYNPDMASKNSATDESAYKCWASGGLAGFTPDTIISSSGLNDRQPLGQYGNGYVALATAPSYNNNQDLSNSANLIGPKSIELPMNSWFNMKFYIDMLSKNSSYTNSVNPYAHFPYITTTAWPEGGNTAGNAAVDGGSSMRVVFDTGKSAPSATGSGLSPTNDENKNLLYLDIPWPNTKDTSSCFANQGNTAAIDYVGPYPTYMTIWVQNFRWVRGTQNNSTRPGLTDILFKYGDVSASGSSMQAEMLLDNVKLINFWPQPVNCSAATPSINAWGIKNQSHYSPMTTISESHGSDNYTGSSMGCTDTTSASIKGDGPTMTKFVQAPSSALTIGVDDKDGFPTTGTNVSSGYLLFNNFSSVNYGLLDRINTANLIGSGATLSVSETLSGTALNTSVQKLGSQFVGGKDTGGSAQYYGTVAQTNAAYDDPTHRGPRVYAVSGAENVNNTLSLASGSNTTMSTDGFTQKGFARWSISGSATNAQATYGTWGRRENVLASTKIMACAATDKKLTQYQVRVADMSVINSLNANEQYVIYRAYKNSGTPLDTKGYFAKTGLVLDSTEARSADDNVLTFTSLVTTSDTGLTLCSANTLSELYISPYKYWVNILFPGNTEDLIERTYGQICMVNETPSDSDDSQLGSTWNEETYTYYTANEATTQGGRAAPYSEPWKFSTVPTETILDLETDYGFGVVSEQDPDGLGCVDRKYAVSGSWIDWDLTPLLTSGNLLPGSDFNLLGKIDAIVQNKTVKLVSDTGTIPSTTGSYKPAYYLQYFDAVPETPVLKVNPTTQLLSTKANKDIDLYAIQSQDLNSIKFEWNEKDDDIWYRYIVKGQNIAISDKYSMAVGWVPLNEVPLNQDISLESTYYVYNPKENATPVALTQATTVTPTAGVKSDFNGLSGMAPQFKNSSIGPVNNDVLKFTSAQNSFPSGNNASGFSIVVHCIPEQNGTYTSQTILRRVNGIEISIANGVVKVGEAYNTNLTGTTVLPMDGKTPLNVIATFKSGSKIGPDAQLYVNGVLEDFVMDVTGTDIDGTGDFFIGGPAGTGYGTFYGSIEEIVMYDQPLIVPTEANEYIYNTADLEDKSGSDLITHTAKLFLFDYHNIRGRSAREVASSNVVNWRATTL